MIDANRLVDDEFNFLLFLSETAHNASLGIALKNSPDMIANRPEIVNLTDFAIIEQCQAYDECDSYLPFIQAGKPTWDNEYQDSHPASLDCNIPGMQMTNYKR